MFEEISLWMGVVALVSSCLKLPVQAISRVGRLGVLVVTDWIVELTAYTFDGRSNCQYNCRGRAPRVLLVRVSAWVRLRARARK